MYQQKGFLGRLFDLSFSEFITPSIIKIIYVLTMVMIGLGLLAYIIVGFAAGGAIGIVVLIFSPLIFLIYVIFARIWLEIVIVLFNIGDDLRLIRLQEAPTVAAENGCSNCGTVNSPGSAYCMKCGNSLP